MKVNKPKTPSKTPISLSFKLKRPEKDVEVDELSKEFEKTLRQKRQTLENQNLENIVNARSDYSVIVYITVVFWLNFVGLIVLLQGFQWYKIRNKSSLDYYFFELSDTVLVTLIGSATVSIVGLFAIVLRYFFSSHGSHDKSGNTSEDKDSS